MNLADLNHLKNLSWYTTVPLLVSAWMLQNAPELAAEVSTLLGLMAVVGEYFIKVVAGLFFAYVCWLYASVYIDAAEFPFTLLLATFLLTLACVGMGIYILKPTNIVLPVNFLWFASCGSIAFNLYQIHSSIYGNDEHRT